MNGRPEGGSGIVDTGPTTPPNDGSGGQGVFDFGDRFKKPEPKSAGEDHIKVPTPDGMVLKYSFKENAGYNGKDVTLPNGRSIRLGYQNGEVKLGGRGLAAFMAHMIDAYVLRESHARMAKGGLKTFNPIHDSFGFHPSEAKRGQETVLQVMQEVGNPDYNLFLQILETNGIGLKDFTTNGGIIPNRQAVEPQQPWQIPTALS